MFFHSVYFWIYPSITLEQRKTFEAELNHLLKIDSIENGQWGKVARKALRDVVDDSYDYVLNINFKNEQNHEHYQNNDNHQKFVKIYQSFWKKVKVYDSIII